MAIIKVQHQYRNDTAANWTSVNPILEVAEPGYENDTGKFKMGDGATAWNSLPYTVGADGPMGPPGPAGPAGVDGQDGQDGTDGAQGIPGINGTDGADGAPGADGTDGAPGADGADGAPGAPGADGADGAQGLPGADGADGATGPQGDQGIPGVAGADGNDGVDGAQGLPGNDGVDGAQGPPGNDGVDGADGAQGIQGIPGLPGADGADGADGVDGAGGLVSYASFHLGTGGLTGISNTALTLVINETGLNTGEYTLSGNQITISAAGDYEINAFSYINNSTTSRTEYTMWLEVDGVEVPGTRSGIYERGYDSGSTGSICKIMAITAAQVVRLRIVRTDGNSTAGYQDNNGTGITLKKLNG